VKIQKGALLEDGTKMKTPNNVPWVWAPIGKPLRWPPKSTEGARILIECGKAAPGPPQATDVVEFVPPNREKRARNDDHQEETAEAVHLTKLQAAWLVGGGSQSSEIQGPPEKVPKSVKVPKPPPGLPSPVVDVEDKDEVKQPGPKPLQTRSKSTPQAPPPANVSTSDASLRKEMGPFLPPGAPPPRSGYLALDRGRQLSSAPLQDLYIRMLALLNKKANRCAKIGELASADAGIPDAASRWASLTGGSKRGQVIKALQQLERELPGTFTFHDLGTTNPSISPGSSWMEAGFE
jgi:hypothetical protein